MFKNIVVGALIMSGIGIGKNTAIEFQKPETQKVQEIKTKENIQNSAWENTLAISVEQQQDPKVKQRLVELDKQLAMIVEKSINEAPFIEAKPLEDKINSPDVITTSNIAKSCIRNWIKTPFTVQATATWRLPISTCATSLFGGRSLGKHEGLDFSCRDGKDIPVTSASDGVVVSMTNDFGVGGLKSEFVKKVNYVAIANQERTLITRYLHLAKTSQDIVKVGDIIKAGQQIGICGGSGYSQGKHLHLDFMYVKDQNSDPKKYFQQFTNPNQFYKIN